MDTRYNSLQFLLRFYNAIIDQLYIQHVQFVEQAISELIQPGRLIRTEKQPHVVNPLSVSVQSSGELRLILDLRHVNQLIPKIEIMVKC